MKLLITGGTGFLGRHLAVKLREEYDVYLSGRNNKQNRFAQDFTSCQVLPMDICNIESVRDVFDEVNPDIVIHAAATKFVDLSERFPNECIDVNILGSQNVAKVCSQFNTKVCLGISTDKASPPIRNIYGLSKAVMEKLFCSMNDSRGTKYTCVRYGNVAWSTGSVLPIWKKMIETTGVIKTTGPEMRRFFFTVDDAVELVCSALENIDLVEGKVLSREMKATSMIEIIKVWRELTGCSFEVIEGRPGDRLDEYLIGEAEVEHTEVIDLPGSKLNYFLLHRNFKPENRLEKSYHSGNAKRLTNEEIVHLLTNIPEDL